jgi:hypothetical protein
MGNSPPHSKEREAPPKFKWIESGMVFSEDLDVVWSYYSKDGKTILKGDTIAFAEEVVSVS